MASGFCLRVLLLSLISYGQFTLGNLSRHQGRNSRPYSEQAEASPRSSNPVPRRSDSVVQPRAAAATSKVPEGFKPFESVGLQGGQVDSYSQKGSVPSYSPASNPSQVSQSSFNQRKPDWHPESSKGGRRGSNIVSSGAIVMKAEQPPQQELDSPNSDLRSKTSPWDGASSMQSTYSGQEQPVRPAPPSRSKAGSKAGMRDNTLASNAQSPGRLSAAQPSLQLPASGMWDNVYTSGITSPGMYPSSKLPQMPLAPKLPRQHNKATWKIVPSSNLQYPWTYSNAQPSSKQPVSSAALNTKADMRDSRYAPSAQPIPNHPAFSAPAVLQSKEGMWDSVFTSPQSQMYSSSYPVFLAAVPQTEGVWGSELASGPKSTDSEHITPRGYKPSPLSEYFSDYFRGWQRPAWVPKLQLPSNLPHFNLFPNRAGMVDADTEEGEDQAPRLSRPVPGSSRRHGMQPQRSSAQRNLASAQRNRRPLVS